MREDRTIPQLRFPEFEGDWVEKKLGEIAEINPKSGMLPSSFIYIDLESVIDGKLIKEENIELENAPSRAQRLLKEGDVLFQMVRPYQKNNLHFKKQGDYVSSTGYAQLRSKINSEFLFQYLHFQKFNDKVLERCTGTSYPAINSTDLSHIPICFPTHPLERQKIASFLTAIDRRITILDQKKRKLEQYKDGVMQKLFSRELRFKDENGNEFPEWEERKLKEIGEFKNGINKSKEDFGFGYPFINLMDVFGKPTISNLKLDLVNANEKELKLYELKKGDVLFIRSSVKKTGVGETSLVLEDLKNTVFSGFLIRFRDEKIPLDLNFKKYCFSNLEFRKKLISSSTTSANTNINQESLNELEISYPCIPEQQKIASFLTTLDAKIEMVTAEIKGSKAFKQGLLQKMFV